MNISTLSAASLKPESNSAERFPEGNEFWTFGRFTVALAIALLAAFPTIALGTHTFFARDFGAMWYPVYHYTKENLLAGRIPLWNPYIHCGVPFQAQMGQWYPPLLLALLFPMPSSIGALTLTHLLWSGLGMYWLTRRWGVSSFAASFAGMAYVFNGAVLSSITWISYTGTLAWLPWVIGCGVASWTCGGRWLVLAALCSAMQVLAGTPELTVLTWLLLALLWVKALFGREIQLGASALRTGGIIGLAGGLTMIQILPFFDLVTHSQRNSGYGTDAWSMPAWGYANLLVPLFHCYKSPLAQWFQSGQDLLPSYYLGAGVLVLALTACLVARRWFTWALVGMLVFCWVMSLGTQGGLYLWLRRAIPALGFFRYPVKLAIFPAFLVPALAAGAIHAVQRQPTGKPARWIVGITATALAAMGMLLWVAKTHPLASDDWQMTAWNTFWRAGLALAVVGGVLLLNRVRSPRRRACLQAAVLALLPVDALTHSPNIAPTLPSSVMAAGMWNAGGKCPAPKPGEGRVMLSPEAEQLFVHSYVTNFAEDFACKRLGQWYDLNLLDHVPKVNGAIPLHPPHYDLLENHLYYKPRARYGSALLDFLSVAWYLRADSEVAWVSRTNYLPILTAGQAAVFAGDQQALDAITADTFRPTREVYLEEGARRFVTATNAARCDVRNTRYSPQRIEANVTASETTMAVVAQTYYHLWRANVDGKPARLFRANVAFQAVQVPPGQHHIEFVYCDYNLIAGAVLTAISLALSVWLWFKTRALLP